MKSRILKPIVFCWSYQSLLPYWFYMYIVRKIITIAKRVFARPNTNDSLEDVNDSELVVIKTKSKASQAIALVDELKDKKTVRRRAKAFRLTHSKKKKSAKSKKERTPELIHKPDKLNSISNSSSSNSTPSSSSSFVSRSNSASVEDVQVCSPEVSSSSNNISITSANLSINSSTSTNELRRSKRILKLKPVNLNRGSGSPDMGSGSRYQRNHLKVGGSYESQEYSSSISDHRHQQTNR